MTLSGQGMRDSGKRVPAILRLVLLGHLHLPAEHLLALQVLTYAPTFFERSTKSWRRTTTNASR